MQKINNRKIKRKIINIFDPTVMTKDELMEFWYGLVNSKKHFLWAIRPNLVTQKDGEDQIPLELIEGTNDRGYMVGWVPQEEVLAH